MLEKQGTRKKAIVFSFALSFYPRTYGRISLYVRHCMPRTRDRWVYKHPAFCSCQELFTGSITARVLTLSVECLAVFFR